MGTKQSNWQLTEYSYDELGRVVTVTETELTEVVTPTLFTVTLDANGGTVSSTVMTVWNTEATVLPTPTRTGYTFDGWYNGDTLVAKSSAAYITADCTLTAKWIANTYTIVAHGNGGRLANGETEITLTCTYGEEITLPANPFTYSACEFVGWEHRGKTVDGEIVVYADRQAGLINLTATANGEVHLYAVWAPVNQEEDDETCTVVLDANGGTVSPGTLSLEVGTTLTPPTLTRKGYVFNGWYLGSTLIAPGDSVQIDGDCVLVAKWTPIKYTLIFDANGGSKASNSIPATQTWYYDQSYMMPTLLYKRTGYTLVGWSTKTTGAPQFAPDEIVTNLTAINFATIRLYAIWQKNADATTGRTYDLRGSDNSETSYVKTYEYDLAGNRTRFALTKDGETVHNIVYHYDALNRLTALEQDGEIVAEYTYDVNGNRASLTCATGTVTTYSYNLANWVTGMTSVSGGTVLTDYSYTYYADGNRRSETDRVSNAVTTYVYDDLGRLVQESETDGLTISYTYDLSGNRTQMAVSGAENYTVEYTYDANNRLEQEKKTQGITTTTTLYTYDDNGNLLRKGTVDGAELYEYNGFNQLVVLKQGDSGAAYGYNASGIRVSKQVGDTYTYYLLDGGDVVAECEGGSLSAIYTRGINLVSRLTMDGMEFYLHDAHGDVVALTDGFGAFVKSYDYDAFGNEKNPDSEDTNPFRYCGEYFDTETGTYYLRARYYDPAIGRFTQQDTHWSSANMIYGDNPKKIYERQDALGLSTCTYAPEISAIMQSGNLYVYCTNSPVMYSDPSGQTATEEALSSLYNWLITAWWIPFVDGPIPVAEIALAVVTTILVVDVGASYLADAAQTRAWVVNKIETGGENKNNLKNHSVYVIYETGTTDVWYVGRTSNYEARQKAHQRSGGRFPSAQFTMIPVKTGLSLEDARALEETLICAFLADLCFQNAIHSIARKKWSKFEKNFQRASSLIGALLDD